MNKPAQNSQITPLFSWDDIDTVLLDMDGTLLDKYFDDYFWETFVPQQFSLKNGVSDKEARETLLAKYKSVENTLQWTDLNYWSERLGLDIPGLKIEIQHLINVHPHVHDFLQFVKKSGKQLCLVTNAHPKTLEIKLKKTEIGHYFETIVCSDEVGEAKEQTKFWHGLEEFISFDKKSTLFADDTEKVLVAADSYGIEHLVHIALPSSRLPVRYSSRFPSIATFDELIK